MLQRLSTGGTVGGGGGSTSGGKLREGKISAHLQFWCGAIGRGKLQHPQKMRPFLHSNQPNKHSRGRPTSHSQASKMNGRDEQTDCQQQRNNTWLPPERMHKEQEVPQIAQKKFGGKLSTLVRDFHGLSKAVRDLACLYQLMCQGTVSLGWLWVCCRDLQKCGEASKKPMSQTNLPWWWCGTHQYHSVAALHCTCKRHSPCTAALRTQVPQPRTGV